MYFTKEHSLALKGIAIILMICHHCYFSPNAYDGCDINFYPLTETQANRFFTFFKLCVGTFAFISGYGLACYFKKQDEKISKHCLRRYIKSMSGFWFVYILCFVFGLFITDYTRQIYFTDNLFTTLCNIIIGFLGLSNLLGTPMYVWEWWYLSALVVYIFLTPLLLKCIQKYGALFTIVWVVFLPRCLGVSFQGGTSVLSFIMPLTLGIVFSEYNFFDKLNQIKITNNTLILNYLCKLVFYLFLMFIVYKLYFFLPFESYWELKYGLVPLIFICFFNGCISCFDYIRKAFAFLGKHSANMYFIHTVFLYVYLKDFLYNQPWFMITPLLLTLICLLVSICLEYVKKIFQYELFVTKICAPPRCRKSN